MSESRAIVLKLIRMAMGWETDFSLPKEIDWEEILNIAQDQGVDAIVLDGIEEYQSMCKHPTPF